MVVRISPLATTGCESRQARKGATVAAASGAGVWRVRATTLIPAARIPAVIAPHAGTRKTALTGEA